VANINNRTLPMGILINCNWVCCVMSEAVLNYYYYYLFR